MCGIFGYCGNKSAAPILLDGLKRLEYRGYDSAGVSVGVNKKILTKKSKGKVSDLEPEALKLDGKASFGIAHTRWATHGKPSDINAHPHLDCTGKISIVHNGIIENFQQLKEELIKKGHKFISQTDTEVIAHLIEKNYKGDIETAVLKSVHRLEGSFAIAAIHADNDHKIVLVKRGSPIIIGVGEDEYFAASDTNALSSHTTKLIYLNDDEIAVLNKDGYHIKNLNNEFLEKKIEILDEKQEAPDKKGYEHYMLKEIFEQPESIENAFRGRINSSEGVSKLGGLERVIDRIKQIRKLIIIGCGTSFYAGKIGRYVFEELTDLTVDVELASEFRYRRLKPKSDVGVLALSQSGETADTIAALKEAKRKGALLLGVVNIVGSTITQLTDAGVYNHAGPEIAVASTKIYTSQLVIMNLIALMVGRYQGVSYTKGTKIINEINRLPDKVKEILDNNEEIKKIAKKYAKFNNFLYIGRLFNYPTAMEGALKLKEISYIHAEGYPAGEMKHGPISLIDENFPTVAIAPFDSTFEKMISNIQEIKAREGKVFTVTNSSSKEIDDISDDIFLVPETIEILQPILNVIPLQLFAYYIAKERGCNIDKPRNLAKSVTVE